LNLFIITSVLLIEEDDEDEPTWPKELYKLSFSNFGAGCEQKMVEHVNGHLKNFSTLRDSFIHSHIIFILPFDQN
jgi:hypothetical protein